MKLCYTIGKDGSLSEKKTFEFCHGSESLINTDKYFKLENRKTVNEKCLLPWKRSSDRWNTFVKKTTLNDFKRLPPDAFGKMLPHFVEKKQWFQRLPKFFNFMFPGLP